MTGSLTSAQRLRNGLVAVVVVLLALGIVLANRLGSNTPTLEKLARQAIPLEVARSNGKPTLMEFYADWCASCRSMVPLMSTLQQDFGNSVNFVMLNVDNTKWLPEMSQFRVSGIPHFVYLDPQGSPLQSAIGEQPEPVLRQNLLALQLGQFEDLMGSTGQTSALVGSRPAQPDPQSHG